MFDRIVSKKIHPRRPRTRVFPLASASAYPMNAFPCVKTETRTTRQLNFHFLLSPSESHQSGWLVALCGGSCKPKLEYVILSCASAMPYCIHISGGQTTTTMCGLPLIAAATLRALLGPLLVLSSLHDMFKRKTTPRQTARVIVTFEVFCLRFGIC